MTARKAGRGGARKGAGRPARAANGGKRKVRSVQYADDEDAEIVKAAGAEPVAAFIRRASLKEARRINKKGRR